MAKEFYTERDIEDMVKRGILSLEVNDNVVLTDLAYEKAHKLGMKLARDKPDNPPAAPERPYLSQTPTIPAPPSAAPVRPYLSQPQPQPRPAAPAAPPPSALTVVRTSASAGQEVPAPQPDGAEMRKRIHSAVIARLGTQVDEALLDVIITRVLQNTGIR